MVASTYRDEPLIRTQFYLIRQKDPPMNKIEVENVCQPGKVAREYAKMRKGGLLGLVVAAAFLGTAPVARAGCGEQTMQSELAEPKALGRAGLRSQFRDFVLREFPVGSDGGRLLRWLQRSDFSEPYTTYLAVMTLTTENRDKEEAAAAERQRQGSPLQASNQSFNSLCGQSVYEVYWKLDTCSRIVELSTDEFRCRLDLP
jgi:hypothetical protein